MSGSTKFTMNSSDFVRPRLVAITVRCRSPEIRTTDHLFFPITTCSSAPAVWFYPRQLSSLCGKYFIPYQFVWRRQFTVFHFIPPRCCSRSATHTAASGVGNIFMSRENYSLFLFELALPGMTDIKKLIQNSQGSVDRIRDR